MPRIQLLASDLDGTLLDHQAQASPGVRAAIAELQARGVRVIAATGRMARSTRPIVKDLGLDAPMICYQGAYVEGEGEVWRHRQLPRALSEELLGELEALGPLQINLYAGDQLYLRRVSPEAEAYMRLAQVSSVQVGRWEEAFEAAASAGAQGATKVVAIGEPARIQALLPEAQARWAGRLHATSSLPHYLEFTEPGGNKGLALAEVAQRLGIPLEATCALGDGLNDLELLNTAGLGIAMGQGPEALHRVAQRVAPPFAEDGAAVAIRTLLEEGLV